MLTARISRTKVRGTYFTPCQELKCSFNRPHTHRVRSLGLLRQTVQNYLNFPVTFSRILIHCTFPDFLNGHRINTYSPSEIDTHTTVRLRRTVALEQRSHQQITAGSRDDAT